MFFSFLFFSSECHQRVHRVQNGKKKITVDEKGVTKVLRNFCEETKGKRRRRRRKETIFDEL